MLWIIPTTTSPSYKDEMIEYILEELRLKVPIITCFYILYHFTTQGKILSESQSLNEISLFLTYKPAIITFLHNLYNVSFSELQLIWILGFVVVNGFVSRIENTNNRQTTGLSHKFKASTLGLHHNNLNKPKQFHLETYGWRCTTVEPGLFRTFVCFRELACALGGVAWLGMAPYKDGNHMSGVMK